MVWGAVGRGIWTAGRLTQRYAPRIYRGLGRMYMRRMAARRMAGRMIGSGVSTGMKRSAAVAGLGAAAAGSFIKRRKKPNNNFVIKSTDPGSTTHSKNSLTYKPARGLKTLKSIGSPCKYEAISTFSLVGTNGLQCITGDATNAELPRIFGKSQLGNIYNAIARSYVVKSTTGAEYLTQVYNTSSSEAKKFAVNHGQYRVTLSNQAPSTAKVTIYVLQSKTSSTVAELPHSAWSAGLVATQVGGSTNSPAFPNSSPTMSKEFNLKWKVLKKQNVDLHAGADHEHVFNFAIKRIIDTTYMNNFEDIRGITHKVMIVARGSVADTANNKTVGTITTSDIKIVGTIKETYTAQMLTYWPRVVFQNNGLAATAANLWEIGEGGAPVDVEAAANYA